MVNSTNQFHKLLSGLMLIGGFFMSSCNIINPPEKIPAYVTVEPFTMYATSSDQGSNSNKIEDAWFYVGEELQGVYPLLNTFPVLEEGTYPVKIRPGIYFNGSKSQRFPYPFYAIYDTVVHLIPGNDISIIPRTTYIAGLQITNEPFENNGGIIFDTTAISQTVMSVTSDPNEIFEGTGSGKAVLNSTHAILEMITGTLALPYQGNEKTFIELNYKTSVLLAIGFYTTSNGTEYQVGVITLVPNTEWNKLYLDITNPIHGYGNPAGYQIFIYAQIDDLTQTREIFLDNFKVVHN